MDDNFGLNEFGGLLLYLFSYAISAIAALFLYIFLFVLTVTGLYFIKKNGLEEVVPGHEGSNVIYLNSTSKQWHKIRRNV